MRSRWLWPGCHSGSGAPRPLAPRLRPSQFACLLFLSSRRSATMSDMAPIDVVAMIVLVLIVGSLGVRIYGWYRRRGPGAE
jgi:hypothetical protein